MVCGTLPVVTRVSDAGPRKDRDAGAIQIHPVSPLHVTIGSRREKMSSLRSRFPCRINFAKRVRFFSPIYLRVVMSKRFHTYFCPSGFFTMILSLTASVIAFLEPFFHSCEHNELPVAFLFELHPCRRLVRSFASPPCTRECCLGPQQVFTAVDKFGFAFYDVAHRRGCLP